MGPHSPRALIPSVCLHLPHPLLSHSWEPLVDDINATNTKYFDAEMSLKRPTHISDERVHCCLYFIAPTGRG